MTSPLAELITADMNSVVVGSSQYQARRHLDWNRVGRGAPEDRQSDRRSSCPGLIGEISKKQNKINKSTRLIQFCSKPNVWPNIWLRKL